MGHSIKGVWDTGGIGHMGNGGTGGMGYGQWVQQYGHMGNGNTWGSRVQGVWEIGVYGAIGYRYGVQDTFAMGTGGVGHMGQ